MNQNEIIRIESTTFKRLMKIHKYIYKTLSSHFS